MTTTEPVGAPAGAVGVAGGTAGSAPSCHEAGPVRDAGPGAPVVALAGAPNVGKSSLFNALTGARRTVGNWPGTTVEVGRGAWRLPAAPADPSSGGGTSGAVSLVDLPGAYSLDPVSPDEELTRALLLDVPAHQRPDVVVVAVDAAHLARSLYLVAQLREQAMRVVVALTMVDVAERRGVRVGVTALAGSLGVPVVALDPRRRTGTADLAAAVAQELGEPVPAPRPLAAGASEDELAAADDRFAWVAAALAASTEGGEGARRTRSDRVDRWATAPVLGPLLFLGVMWVVFQVTTTVAAPLQTGLGALVSGPVSAAARGLLGALGLGGTWVAGLVVDGLVAGVGMLLTFAPLMAIMFAVLAVLEDSGYMARAAVVTDRLMRTIGLPGRAFLPLVVGFGCNVPAISATRALPNARHRLLTVLLVPFTSCSARLTVYVLVAATFFPAHAGTVVFTMYVASVLLVVGVGLLLRSTLWRAMGAEPLVLDLPPYQVPSPRGVGAVTWARLRGFLRTAGGVIVVTVSAVWLLQATPVSTGGSFGRVPVAQSAYGTAARAVTPVFAPTGFDDWHTTSALVVGFVAKEAVISSWAQTYATQEPSDGSHPGGLGQQVSADFERSSGGHSGAAAWAFLIFLLAYTPCVATLAAQRREVGLRWTAFGVGMQLVVAWTLAAAVFQLGRVLS